MKTEQISTPQFNLVLTEVPGDEIELGGRMFKTVATLELKPHDIVDVVDGEFVIKDNDETYETFLIALEVIQTGTDRLLAPLYVIRPGNDGQSVPYHLIFNEKVIIDSLRTFEFTKEWASDDTVTIENNVVTTTNAIQWYIERLDTTDAVGLTDENSPYVPFLKLVATRTSVVGDFSTDYYLVRNRFDDTSILTTGDTPGSLKHIEVKREVEDIMNVLYTVAHYTRGDE